MSWTGVAAEHEPVVSWMQREREEGRQEGIRELIRRCLIQRFGALRPEHERALAAATPERLDRWADTFLTSPTAAAVFETP